jgi:hypothetical protein
VGSKESQLGIRSCLRAEIMGWQGQGEEIFIPVYHPEPSGAHWSLIRIRAQGEGPMAVEHFDSADADRGDGGGGWQKRAQAMLILLLGRDVAITWQQRQVGHQTGLMGCGIYVAVYMASVASSKGKNPKLGAHKELTPAYVNEALRPRLRSAFNAVAGRQRGQLIKGPDLMSTE